MPDWRKRSVRPDAIVEGKKDSQSWDGEISKDNVGDSVGARRRVSSARYGLLQLDHSDIVVVVADIVNIKLEGLLLNLNFASSKIGVVAVTGALVIQRLSKRLYYFRFQSHVVSVDFKVRNTRFNALSVDFTHSWPCAFQRSAFIDGFYKFQPWVFNSSSGDGAQTFVLNEVVLVWISNEFFEGSFSLGKWQLYIRC